MYPSDENELISLAKQARWTHLVDLAIREPYLAHVHDRLNMLPLHWACMHPHVPASVVATLLDAFPSAINTQNVLGYVPLNVAIQSQCDTQVVHLLYTANPNHIEKQDSSKHYRRRNPLYTNSNQEEDDETIHRPLPILLAQYHPRHFGQHSKALKTPETSPRDEARKTDEEEDANDKVGGRVSLLDTPLLPPRWKNSKSCGICDVEFKWFSLARYRRHHCRSCGMSVCNEHSLQNQQLLRYGIRREVRVCDNCVVRLPNP